MSRRFAELAVAAAAVLAVVFSVGFAIGSRRTQDGAALVLTGRTPQTAESTVSAEEAPSGAEAEPEQPDGPLDLNTATLEELQTLPGVGPVLAQRILDYRAACGGFYTPEQLMEVSGIGEARYAALKDFITVEGKP